MFYRLFFLASVFLSTNIKAEESKDGYVTVKLMGQLGNQMFQLAAAYAYALDHDILLTVPDLLHNQSFGIPHNAQELFLDRILSEKIPFPLQLRWSEPSFNYTKIPASNAIELFGYFQSEKYFADRREELLSLFAVPTKMNETILDKYPFLASDSLVVGIQIRDYRREYPSEQYHPTHKRSYYEKAMALFPEDAIFVVSSNNKDFAMECIHGIRDNIVYLDADYIEEFYTLVLCKSFIISNSSFGWWASWLSVSPDKKVIAPNPWFASPYNNQAMVKDLLPVDYLVIEK